MKVSEESRTFVPYYDSIIERELRGDLCRIKMNPLTKSKVNNQALRATMMAKSKDLYLVDDDNRLIHHQQSQSKDLITYMPKMNCNSKILNDLQISNLVS